MNTTKVQVIFTVFIGLFTIQSYAQDTIENNFYNRIKSYNLSKVLMADSVETEYDDQQPTKVKRPEILGFIGSDFQRFQIHFTSIVKNPKNPYNYFVDGKTLVKGKRCSFKGTITIQKAELYQSDDPNYQQGTSTCEVILYENKNELYSGFIKGTLKSNFAIDKKQQFKYDALMLVSDSFSNNEFVGTWTSYKTNISKKCNWGDYRIPNCGDLDNGAGEFYVSTKYIKNGWVGYMIEHKMDNAAISQTKGKAKNWWE
ncbi:MAG: hypothetical protein V5804_09605 [Mucilaginibacter sp.]|uniref:hypothetical protein n=1 Tax=Mucilaginibacter sp. TaxID=1882438 RepID=UPI0034E424E4